MATIIREEMFLVDEIEIVYNYTHYNHYNRQSKATSQNTLPQNYQRSADKYNKKTNKHFTKVWNADKREWQTVSVPPYAENIIYSDGEDSEVIDVYDTETGTYKRRGLIKCEICQKESVRMLYIVREHNIMRACSFECVEALRRNERAEKEADNILTNAQKEKRKEALKVRLIKEYKELEEKNGWLIPCMVCGKKPKPLEWALTRIQSNDGDFYSFTCSVKCAYIMYELSKEPVYEERRFQPVGQIVFPDMTPYACKVCGKVPVDLVQAMVGVHRRDTPEDATLYSIACSVECALKIPKKS